MAKRLMCIILSVLMIVSLLPTGAFATEANDDVSSLVEDAGSTGTETDESIGEEDTEANADASGDEQAEEVAEDLVEETSEPVAAANEEIEEDSSSSSTTTLQSQIDSASTTATTITLSTDVTEDITIASSQNITIDLNGHNITNASGDTITVALGATLTITGTGTVDNVTHGKAAIFNNGTVTLHGGTYTRSQETGTSTATGVVTNSYYNIVNHGTMTINSCVTVTQSGNFSSMIENGYYNYYDSNSRSGYVSDTNAQNPLLTINGGTFTGGLNTVKNDDGGILYVYGGTFSNTTQATIMNANVATITDGNFTSEYAVVLNAAFTGTVNAGTLTISGGTFTAGSGYSVIDRHSAANASGTISISGGTFTSGSGATLLSSSAAASESVTISGGTFSGDVSAYCTDGYAAVYDSTKGTYSVETGVAGVYDASGNCLATYDTLYAASTNATTGQTVKLIADVGSESSEANDYFRVDSEKNISLDLNGYSIYACSSEKNTAILVTGSSTLKVTNSSTETGVVTSTGTKALWAISGSVTIDTKGYVWTGATNAVLVQSQSTYNQNDIVVTIDNGAFYGKTAVAIKNDIGDTVINGGLFVGYSTNDEKSICVAGGSAVSSGTVTINGGYFYGTLSTQQSTFTVSGGYFTDGIDSKILVAGKNLVSIDDKETVDDGYNTEYDYKYTVGDYAFEFGIVTSGGTYTPVGYVSTISNAWNGVNGIDTTEYTDINRYYIKMYSDYTIRNSTFDTSSFTTTTCRKFELDLNGHTLTSTGTASATITVQSNDTLTIVDTSTAKTGMVTGAASSPYGTVKNRGGTLIIEGGTYENTAGLLVNNNGDNASSAVTTITGGNFIINDGTSPFYKVSGSTLEIKGGNFTSAPSSDFLASGYAVLVTSDETYPYTVGEAETLASSAVAKIDSVYYTSLSSAISSAASGETVTVLSDIKLEAQVEVTGTVVLELNGHSIERDPDTNKTAALLLVSTDSELTVQDTSEGANGYIDGATYSTSEGTYVGYGIQIAGGTVKVVSGTVKGYRGVYISGDSSSLVVNGGAVSGTTYGVYQVSGSTEVKSGSVTGTSRGISASTGTVTVEGGTVTGTSDFGIFMNNGTVNVSGGSVVCTSGTGIKIQGGTVNVSGGTISASTGINALAYNSAATVNITNGNITSTDIGVFAYYYYYDAEVNVSGNSTITVNGEEANGWTYGIELCAGTTASVSDNATITATNSGENGGSAGIIYIGNGDSDNPTTLNISGGTISGETYGLSGNGSASYSEVTITGGKISSGFVAIYHPEMGDISVSGDSTEITGVYAGIQLMAGSLTVSGGTIKATATASEVSDNANSVGNKTGDGAIADGAAISIINRKGYGNTQSGGTVSYESVEISGGTVISATGVDAVQAYALTSNAYVDWDVSGVSITGGSFSSIVSEDLCGGSYVPGTTTDDNGYYTVVEGTTVAKIDTTEYVTLKKALTAASAGDTITLVANATVTADATADVTGTVTIDLAGKNLTIYSGITLTVASGTTVVIKDTASTGGLVTNNGVIAVEGTLDIRDLGYTTSASGSGLLGHEGGKITLGASSTFIVLDVWNDMWSTLGTWSPNWTSATGSNGIISSAAKGAKIYSYGVGYVCDADVTSDTYVSGTYWDLSGTYLVEYYKKSATASDWAYPSIEDSNTIFAGWYSDDEYSSVYTTTSGEAYAKFVTLSGDSSEAGVINFLGGSLKTDIVDENNDPVYSYTSLRFGYDIVLPSGCDTTYSWQWKWSKDGTTVAGTKDGYYWSDAKNTYETGLKAFRSNLLISNIPAASYKATIYSALTVTYVTADGTTVTASEASYDSRSVYEIAYTIANSEDSSDKEFASNIISAIPSDSN
ncbi:MAG: hypothetical protein LUG86_06740 [Oscillospiraceae bacterium]|nr:hypothetical protein [Oscillospiraceae bacterium]